LRPKFGCLLFGRCARRQLFFYFIIFLLDEWSAYFTSFPVTPSISNSNSIWACGEILFKMDYKFIFPLFLEELLYPPTWLELPKDSRSRCQKRFFIECLAHKILGFHYFSIFVLLVILHDAIFNVPTLIWMWSLSFFSRNSTSSTMLEFWVKTPINKKNSNSSLLTNLKLGFEPCLLNLI
jgi:hypothetical protein